MKKITIILMFLMLSTFSIFAQNGNIKGSIIDRNGLAVSGADIAITDLKKGSISDFDGKFTFVDIPEGSHTLVIKYLGYADFTQEVIVNTSTTTSVSVVLESQDTELDAVEITSTIKDGQARALNTQKNKQNITNIVSTDQIGKFPDANIGDAVKRIPGITMQVDQGEARNVIIRGLAPQLNSVTLNGSRIPSAEGDNRNVQMDLIPADMIQLIEVNKAVTPDMDADALGGSVNLVTRTSPNGFRLSTTLGSGVNFITDKRILNGSFLIGDRTKNDKLGFMLSASINDSDFGSDNVEAEWVNEAESPITGEDIEVNPFVEESDIRTYLVQRVRRSLALNLDYKFNENNSIFLKSMYNWRDDRENRYRLRYRNMEPIFNSGSEEIIGYEGEIRRQTKGGIDNNRNKNTRLEDQRMQNYSLSGEHLLGKLQLDWLASYASASEERLNERYIEYEIGDAFGINQNLSNTRYPGISAANPADVALSNFELKEITEENQFTKEEDFNFFTNFKLPITMFENEGFVKFGGRVKLKNKERDNNYTEFEPLNGDFDDLTALPLINQTDADFLAGSQYAAGQYVDPAFLGSLNLNDNNAFESEDVPSEYARANYDVKENVYAAYAMIDQKITDKFDVLLGLRLENTKTEATGNEIEGEENILGTITEEKEYTNLLPGVHLKYNVNNNTVLRFAWTNTIARPNYEDIVPSIDVITEDEEIVLGNPNLDATTSMNFDLMAEHYFKNVGIVSGGIFTKSIKDFIYTYQFQDTTTGFDAFQPQNGDDASIYGSEVSFQRQLDFLPGFAKNFNIMLNYTYLTSSANGIRNEDGDERNDVALPGTAENMFNGSLAYGNKRLNLRLSANYSNSYIDEIGGNAFEDRYYDEQFLVDFNASYAFKNGLSIYFDLNNITNQALRYYQGQKNRTMQVEYYGRKIAFGLKYDLFKRK